MKQTLALLWQLFMGMTVTEEEQSVYAFRFYHEVDVERVLEMSPLDVCQSIIVA